MLEPHVREHDDGCVHDARGIESPPQARLHDRHLDLALGHRPQRRRREQFELGHVVVLGERAVHAFGRPARARDGGGELLPVELLAADEHALAVGDQMRGQVGAGAQAVTLEDRGDHARRRGLAVGPQHLDRREAPLGGVERGHHAAHDGYFRRTTRVLEWSSTTSGILQSEEHWRKRPF